MSGEALWRKNFDLMAGDKGGVNKDEFIILCRACGQLMTPQQAEEVMGGIGGKSTYDDFASQMRKGTFGPSPDELLDSLLAFDGNESGFLNKREIINLLTSLGDPMSMEDAGKVFTKFDVPEDGSVKIREFRDYLINPVPLITPNMAELLKDI
jgi:Ca2+-binding EF-hand superfamily protein